MYEYCAIAFATERDERSDVSSGVCPSAGPMTAARLSRLENRS